MKKKKMDLGRKLILNKDNVTSLDGMQGAILGGATGPLCLLTDPSSPCVLCEPPTPTHPVRCTLTETCNFVLSVCRCVE